MGMVDYSSRLLRNERLAVTRMTGCNKVGAKRRRHSTPGRKQREQLILAHLPLLRFIAYRMAMRLPKGTEINDLINAGALGLVDAAAKYDFSHKVQFKTYAEVRIRGAIIDSLRQLDWAPRSLRQKERRLKQACCELSQQLGRTAGDNEVAAGMGMEINGFHKMLAEVNRSTFGSFQTFVSDGAVTDSSTELLEYVPADENTSPHRICERSEMKALLGKAIDELPEKQRLVVSLYYYQDLPMKEIGQLLKVNESRVSQLHKKAMNTLNHRLKKMAPMEALAI